MTINICTFYNIGKKFIDMKRHKKALGYVKYHHQHIELIEITMWKEVGVSSKLVIQTQSLIQFVFLEINNSKLALLCWILTDELF